MVFWSFTFLLGFFFLCLLCFRIPILYVPKIDYFDSFPLKPSVYITTKSAHYLLNTDMINLYCCLLNISISHVILKIHPKEDTQKREERS